MSPCATTLSENSIIHNIDEIMYDNTVKLSYEEIYLNSQMFCKVSKQDFETFGDYDENKKLKYSEIVNNTHMFNIMHSWLNVRTRTPSLEQELERDIKRIKLC